MAFFSPEKLQRRRIEIDQSTATSDSPEIKRRLNRIEQNYQQLDEVLVDIENKLAQDERLAALDNQDVDFESEFGVKPKRKWRSAEKRNKRQKTSSGRPRKPR
jgi:nitrate/nitrite-specific signal transduction histidine kinase